MRTSWKLINKGLGRDHTLHGLQSININGWRTSNHHVIADTFHKHFTTIPNMIKWNITASNCLPKTLVNTHNKLSFSLNQVYQHSFPSIKFPCTTPKEIENIISSHKSSNSCGFDEVPTKLLKSCSCFISSPLNYICNRTLFTGIFPDRLKYANIRPLFKKGNEKDLSSYRPISILTSFSKIFEKEMHTRLLQHLTDHNILVKEQYGFRTKLTTDNMTNEILNALNNNLLIGGIFCDLGKVFDCVNHTVLLTKLEFYGITGRHYSQYKS